MKTSALRQICQKALQREREQVRVVVEEMAQRKLRKAEVDRAREQEKMGH